MFIILNIAIITTIIVIASIGYGSIFNDKKNIFLTFGIGYFLIYGGYQIITSVLIKFNLNVLISLILLGIIVFAGLVLSLINRKKIKYFSFKLDWLFIIFISLMTFVFYNSTLGLESFDSNYYLSMINEFQINDTIGKVFYSYGFDKADFNQLYDFQTYYTYWANILRVQRIFNIELLGYAAINIEQFVWSSSLLYYVAAYGLYAGFIEYFKLNKFRYKIILFVLPLLFFSTQYYVEALAFYGNTYRTLITGYICFKLFDIINSKDYTIKNIILVSLLMSSNIAVSSSGFFINVLLISVLSYFIIKESVEDYALKILLLAVSVLQFAIYYINVTTITLMLLALIIFVLVYNFIEKRYFRNKVNSYIIYLFYFILSIITIYSSYQLIFNNYNHTFFNNHSEVDMVYNFLNITDKTYWSINIYILICLCFYIFKSKNKYKFFLIGALTLYNPINYIFLSDVISGEVYYRMADVIFNQFNLMLVIAFVLKKINLDDKKIKLVTNCIFMYVVLITANKYVTYYHHYFEPSNEYNHIKKIESKNLGVSEALYNDINFNQNYDARVISQFLEIKAYVPTIDTVISYESIRNVDRFSENQVAEELLRVFYPKLNATINTFSDATDYTKACELIIENNVDYVIIENEQNYLAGPHNYIYMNEEVEDCNDAKVIYADEIYTLYKFNNEVIENE